MDAARESLTELEEISRGISPGGGSGGAGGSAKDRIPDALAAVEKARLRLADAVAANLDAIDEARRLCCARSVGRMALWKHDVEGKTWEEAAFEMGFSYKHLERLAASCRQWLYDEMPEEWRRYSIPNALPNDAAGWRPKGK